MATVNATINVPFQTIQLEVESTRLVQATINVPFQSIGLSLLTPNVLVSASIDIPFQTIQLDIGEEADNIVSAIINVPFQSMELQLQGKPTVTMIMSAHLSTLPAVASVATLIDAGPLAVVSTMTCDTSEL